MPRGFSSAGRASLFPNWGFLNLSPKLHGIVGSGHLLAHLQPRPVEMGLAVLHVHGLVPAGARHLSQALRVVDIALVHLDRQHTFGVPGANAGNRNATFRQAVIEDPSPVVHEFLRSAEGMDLGAAFVGLPTANQRRRILDLLRVMEAERRISQPC